MRKQEIKRLSSKEIQDIYSTIKSYHSKYLQQYGVKLPKLTDTHGNFTKDALVLVYLARNYPNTNKVSKAELTQFIRHYYPDAVDVQQARHLGAQKGWFIVSGTRGNQHTTLEYGEYKLVTLEKPYPAFKGHRIRIEDIGEWESLKRQYGYRCITCGSEEGKPNIHWPNTITKLQKAHKDPNKPLIAGNIIPQCEKCNRADRNEITGFTMKEVE